VSTFFRDLPPWIHSRSAAIRFAVSLGLLGLLALAISTTRIPTVFDQVPLLDLWKQQLHQPNHGVRRLGSIEVATVQFDGANLFTVAAPTVWDRRQSTGQLPVEVRAQQIEANLNRVVEGSFIHGNPDGFLTNFDPETLQVSIVVIDEIPVLIAGDGYHSKPLKLVSVTHLDADYNGQSINGLAEQWRSLIYQRLYGALSARSPDALSLKGEMGESLMLLAVTFCASLLLWLLQQPLQRRNRTLRLQQIAIAAEADVNAAGLAAGEDILIARRTAFLDSFQRQQDLQRQRALLSTGRWLLSWMQVGLWAMGIAGALMLFPWTRQTAREFLGTPVALLLIAFLTSAANRLGGLLLDSLAKTWVKRGSPTADALQRDALRLYTIVTMLRPLKVGLIYGAGLALALRYLGIPIGLTISVALIVTLALAFICQNLVRDWIAGGLILREDQYITGDVIRVGSLLGLVERFGWRSTQLRDSLGQLVSIAHSTVTQVSNLTRTWAVVDLEIKLTDDTQMKPTLALVRAVVQQLCDAPEWQQAMAEPPRVTTHDASGQPAVRVWLRTQPLQQRLLTQELRLRIQAALSEAGIVGTTHLKPGRFDGNPFIDISMFELETEQPMQPSGS